MDRSNDRPRGNVYINGGPMIGFHPAHNTGRRTFPRHRVRAPQKRHSSGPKRMKAKEGEVRWR